VNFRDPALVLFKSFRGGRKSYYQVSSLSADEITIKDVEHGGSFTFPRKQLESHINTGLLSVSTVSEIPSSLLLNPVRKKDKPKRSVKITENETEMERRYSYVRAVLDSGIPAYTKKWLEPWLQDQSTFFNDDKPPSYKTLGRWVTAFVESGWKKNALIPNHLAKGNRNSKSKLDSKLNEILDAVIREHSTNRIRINYTKAHQEFIERVEEVNQERLTLHQPPLKPSSYQTTLNRFQK
jgi:hypothetical protein